MIESNILSNAAAADDNGDGCGGGGGCIFKNLKENDLYLCHLAKHCIGKYFIRNFFNTKHTFIDGPFRRIISRKYFRELNLLLLIFGFFFFQ